MGAILPPLGALLTPFGTFGLFCSLHWSNLVSPYHDVLLILYPFRSNLPIVEGLGLGGGGGMFNFRTQFFQHYIPSALNSLNGTVRILLCNLDIIDIYIIHIIYNR